MVVGSLEMCRHQARARGIVLLVVIVVAADLEIVVILLLRVFVLRHSVDQLELPAPLRERF